MQTNKQIFKKVVLNIDATEVSNQQYCFIKPSHLLKPEKHEPFLLQTLKSSVIF